MKQVILHVDFASDGLLIEFESGTRCYYSADFLLANANQALNCTFLDHDPTPNEIRLRHPDLTFSALAAEILPYQRD